MIKLVDVEKTYFSKAGDIAALKKTNIEVKEGEIFGIIGLSGAGKSTLIRCINMLEVPTGGQVFVDGQELTAMNEGQLRKARQNIGMIFQHFNLLASRTVFDNIAFPLEIQGMPKEKIAERVRELLELVQLTDRADYYPSQLSGGQKQRVGIARALASNPKVLLSDTETACRHCPGAGFQPESAAVGRGHVRAGSPDDQINSAAAAGYQQTPEPDDCNDHPSDGSGERNLRPGGGYRKRRHH